MKSTEPRNDDALCAITEIGSIRGVLCGKISRRAKSLRMALGEIMAPHIHGDDVLYIVPNRTESLVRIGRRYGKRQAKTKQSSARQRRLIMVWKVSRLFTRVGVYYDA